MNNPFAGYGGIIEGKRFIGRKKELSQIHNRVLGESFGNLAIMGLPRIGKSSLAHNSLMLMKSELIRRKIIPLWINMGDISSSNDFFLKIVYEISFDLKRHFLEIPIKSFEELIEKLKNDNLWIIERNSVIQEFFRQLKQESLRIIYILDEFDAVRNYFKFADFQFLRELSYNPATKIGLVTVTRRMLKKIEAQNGSISNFYQTFDDLYLGIYNEQDLNEYWNKFFNEIQINEEQKQQICKIAGNHPFLLDLFNFHLFNNLKDNLSESIDETKKSISLSIMNNYKTIMDLLKEENLESKLLQMVVGPVYDITIAEAEEIERYELVKVENKEYKGFSEDFHNYLSLVRREIPIWNIWTETEIRLREIVHLYLVEKFGDDWEDKFVKAFPKKQTLIENLKNAQEKETKSFGDRASKNLLDFTYPSDLFDGFMTTDWSWFGQVFGMQMNDWRPKFQFLARIRNPLAHNKENILKDFEKDIAKGFCEEIIVKINQWYGLKE
jgi:AAA+ ATPase superfamily predicted ATPase